MEAKVHSRPPLTAEPSTEMRKEGKVQQLIRHVSTPSRRKKHVTS